MKRATLICILILVFAGFGAAGNVQFAFDYSAPMPSGFEMRLSATAGGPSARTFDCGPSASKTCVVTSIVPGAWFARLFAYNVSAPAILPSEYSAGSNEVSFMIAAVPAPPTNNHVTGSGSASLNFEVPGDSVATVTLTFDPK